MFDQRLFGRQSQYAAEVVIVSDTPRSPGHYKALIPKDLGIVHVSLEVHRCGAVQEAA
nr:hypothetical protein [uncultured Roseibium sp.]